MGMAVTTNAAGSGGVMDSDVAKLHALGYAQELRRRMGGFSNFAVSFTIICVLSGCLTLFGYGMTTGGPATNNWLVPFTINEKCEVATRTAPNPATDPKHAATTGTSPISATMVSQAGFAGT